METRLPNRAHLGKKPLDLVLGPFLLVDDFDIAFWQCQVLVLVIFFLNNDAVRSPGYKVPQHWYACHRLLMAKQHTADDHQLRVFAVENDGIRRLKLFMPAACENVAHLRSDVLGLAKPA